MAAATVDPCTQVIPALSGKGNPSDPYVYSTALDLTTVFSAASLVSIVTEGGCLKFLLTECDIQDCAGELLVDMLGNAWVPALPGDDPCNAKSNTNTGGAPLEITAPSTANWDVSGPANGVAGGCPAGAGGVWGGPGLVFAGSPLLGAPVYCSATGLRTVPIQYQSMGVSEGTFPNWTVVAVGNNPLGEPFGVGLQTTISTNLSALRPRLIEEHTYAKVRMMEPNYYCLGLGIRITASGGITGDFVELNSDFRSYTSDLFNRMGHWVNYSQVYTSAPAAVVTVTSGLLVRFCNVPPGTTYAGDGLFGFEPTRVHQSLATRSI